MQSSFSFSEAAALGMDAGINSWATMIMAWCWSDVVLAKRKFWYLACPRRSGCSKGLKQPRRSKS
jgi:hypothetical protein